MPSDAYTLRFETLLQDAVDIIQLHARSRTGRPGQQWGLGSLNCAVIVIYVSAWEAYVEEVTTEAVEALRPAAGAPPGNWPALNASARSLIGRFNNPNVEQVRTFLSDAIGLSDVTTSWAWRNCDAARAREPLADAIRPRHQIAHGVHPRPAVQHPYSSRLPDFFRRLGMCTDAAIREHLARTLGVPNPWPA